MKLNGKSGFALILILCGVLILLSKIGFGFGHLAGYLVPFVVIALGYVGIKNGRAMIGTVVLIIGLIMMLGKFAAFFGFVLAVILIAYGFSLLRRNSRTA